MHYAIVKASFSAGDKLEQDQRELQVLVKKIQTKFHVSVKSSNDFSKTGTPEIVVAVLERTDNLLRQKIDEILDFCEASGFGRVEDHEVVADLL
jgi:hypothetical protein